MDRLPDELESNARLRVQKSAVDQGTRRKLNFIAGTNTELVFADDPINEKVDVTVNVPATGGTIDPSTFFPATYVGPSAQDALTIEDGLNNHVITVITTDTGIRFDVPGESGVWVTSDGTSMFVEFSTLAGESSPDAVLGFVGFGQNGYVFLDDGAGHTYSLHPAAGGIDVSSAKITSLANGSASSDAAAFGQIPTFATPAVALGTAGAAGAAGTVIRSDSTIAAFDATAPTTQAVGDSAATGSVAFAARRDHKHGWPSVASFQASLKTPVVLFDHYTDAGNGTTVETDLYSDTTSAGQLAANGDKLTARYSGVFVSSATATREIKVYFAGTVIFDTGALTLSLSSAWDVTVMLIRVSSTVVRYSVSLFTEGAALAAYTSVGELTGLTLSGTNILKITGQAAGVGAATNDIVAKLASIAYQPAA
jgi:hypothetical protein